MGLYEQARSASHKTCVIHQAASKLDRADREELFKALQDDEHISSQALVAALAARNIMLGETSIKIWRRRGGKCKCR